MIYDVTILMKNDNVLKYELMTEQELEQVKDGLKNGFVIFKNRAINTDEISEVVFEELILEQLLREGRIDEIDEDDIGRYSHP